MKKISKIVFVVLKEQVESGLDVLRLIILGNRYFALFLFECLVNSKLRS
jgi:hypothetical protein